jgi:hypothetical protein
MRLSTLLLPLVLTGCSLAPESDPQPLTVTWSVKKADGTPDTCTAPFDKVKVRAVSVDQFEPPYSRQAVFEKVFDCAAGTGTIMLPTSGSPDEECIVDCYGFSDTEATGKYFVTLWITDASGELQRMPSPQFVRRQESSPRVEIDVKGGPRTQDFTFYPHAGFFLVGWSLYAASNNEDVSCNASGIDEIRVRAIAIDQDDVVIPGGIDRVTSFTCPGDPTISVDYMEGANILPPLPVGAYRLEVRGYTNGALVAQRDMSIGEGSNRHTIVGGDIADELAAATLSIQVLTR